MNHESHNLHLIDFADLETRFGKDNAFAILRTLEQFEGVLEARVAKLSWEERLQNVFALMKENMRYQTRH
ncbi:MAG: hypothetical protein M3N08_01045 [Pseudomonadota bacterium]|nr:hypothetical protein [Pseudomonadota bacterium]